MKIFHQIIIIVLGLSLLYVAKDDVLRVYQNIISQDKKEVVNNTLNDAIENKDIVNGIKNDTSETKTVTKPSVVVESPGPLRVASALLGVSTINLSVADTIMFTNKARLNNGNLPALIENSKLNVSAQMKLNDMFARQYFEHESPSGKGASDLADEVSYEYIIIGENLALGNFKNDEALVAAWMASPGHRANILNTKYTQIGVAVGKGTFEGRETWMAVQHFGLPKSACPALDEVLHGVIQANQERIKTMDADLTLRRARIDSGAVYEGKSKNEQIEEYNKLVEIYNLLISETKIKIAEYNTGVNAFNSCITLYTESTS